MYRAKTAISFLVLLLLTAGITSGYCAEDLPADPASKQHTTLQSVGTANSTAVLPATSLYQMSLDELMDLKVTSVVRKPQQLSKSPAAVFVITSEDIRRSGATCIPEALRLAPGVHVARIDGNKWAIAIRGFNSRFANKLLVLMDGRSVYTPLFGGVYWDVQDTMMEDIDRIEVIRGPGATQWGANAVSGVINIITKSSKDTQGGLVTLGGGNEERVFGGLRYGGKIGDKGHFRFYTKYFDRADQSSGSGGDASDAWDVMRAGFRMDFELSTADTVKIQGDYYDGDAGRRQSASAGPDTTDLSGGNILGRWEHVFSETSDMSLQLYYDRTERQDDSFAEDRNTFDIDFQHRFSPFDRHDLMWGFEYRYTRDTTDDPGALALHPDSRSDDRFSFFMQDEITLIAERLFLLVGSKFEHNDYSGFEYQPTVRLSWTPNEQHTLWAAVSRAVRTPTRMEHDQRVTVGPLVVVEGDDDFDSEELLAYELGYRVRPLKNLFVDIAAFYNVYDNLQTDELERSGTATFKNKQDGKSYGIELCVNLALTDSWKVIGGYSYLHSRFDLDASSRSTFTSLDERDPQNMAHIRSYLNLPYNFEFDGGLYYVGAVSDHHVPSYFRFDARLGWRPVKALELSLVLQNAFDHAHPEYGDGKLLESDIRRSVFGKLTWRF